MLRSRRWCSALVAVSAWLVCGWSTGAEPAGAKPTIKEVKNAAGQIVAIEASPLPAGALAKLGKKSDASEALARVLGVFVDETSAGKTAIAGSYSPHEQTLRFTPRFAFRAGQAYRAVLHAEELGAAAAKPVGEVVFRFHAPADAPSPPAQVTAIFPSAAVVPENQLRFYLHFSAPMARGEAYRHVRLLNGRQQPVDLPFLEIGEEFWDPAQQRLTLLLDPGRIKRGLKPREDLGPALHAGDEFTLVVKATWPDAKNRPLGKQFVKRFRVGPPIQRAIDPAQWKISAPTSGSRQPLTIDFPEPLDHALLKRMVSVRSSALGQIEGEVAISRDECRWELRPKNAWPSGQFEIVVERELEDLAGNRIGRAFEVDQAGPIAKPVPADSFRLKFEITAADSPTAKRAGDR